MPTLSDVSPSREDMRKIERKLPAASRAALKRMRRDADESEAASDARWEQQQRYVARRYELQADLARAAANYRNEHARIGHTKDWKAHWRQHFQDVVNEASEALAEHDKARETRMAQRNPDEGGLAKRCEFFLAKNRNAVFRECVAPLPKGDLTKTLAATRDSIADVARTLKEVDAAPLPFGEAMAVVNRELANIATAGKPDLFGPTRLAVGVGDRRSQGPTEWPQVTTVIGESIRKNYDGFSFLVWAFGDLLRPKMEAAVRERIEASAFEPIPAADRPARKAALAAELLGLERTEESIVAALQASGDRNYVRRYDADPLALLGIEIAGTRERKHVGPGSAAEGFYYPPMETPKGQSLPRSSKWTTSGPRNGRDAAE